MGFQDTGMGFPFAPLSLRRKADKRARNTPVQPDNCDWGERSRRELLGQITTFLLRHRLDVTPSNLGIAHAALAGSDLALAQHIADRQMEGHPVTQEWLDSLAGTSDPAEDQLQSIEKMMDELEASISGFAQTTQTACAATGEYRSEFDQHLSAASDGGNGTNSAGFLALSKAMLATLHRIESGMKQSQTETELLQESLTKARREANLDHLTGLPNRRAFERELYAAHNEALADCSELSLAICDVDHFKRVNDTFGHETGDRLLRAIAGILQCYASEDCFVARHGGEEFVMLMRGQGKEDAAQRMNKARRELEQRKFLDRRTKRPIGKVTFSAGIADVLATPNPREALARADEALYQAKEAGRNRIVAA